jgi:Flp pilus assembly protein TadD
VTSTTSQKPILGTSRRLRRAAVLGLAGLVSLGAILFHEAQDRSAVDRAEHWIAVGHNRARASDWNGAIVAYMSALDHRADARTHLFIAAAFLNKKDYELAIMECERAVELEPGNEAAKRSLALAIDASDSDTARSGGPALSRR